MSQERTLPFKVGSGTVCVVLAAVTYLFMWKAVLHWTGKWPAPYWFAVGLGVLVAGGLLRAGWIHFTWLVPFACFAVFVAWFFSFGVYRTWARTLILHDYRWYYENWWPAKIPTVAVVATLVVFLSGHRGSRNAIRLCLAGALFCTLFFGMLAFAEPVCSFYLPRAGTTFHGNYDIFGFRLGGYYLFALVASVSLFKLIMLRKPLNQASETSA